LLTAATVRQAAILAEVRQVGASVLAGTGSDIEAGPQAFDFSHVFSAMSTARILISKD
jgi:hypothetical protein